MKIKSISAVAAALPLAQPMKMGGKELKVAENVFVRIETDSGVIGWGEVSSAPSMTGETVESILAAIRYMQSSLEGRDPTAFSANLGVMDKLMYGNASAKTALEMALYDIAGKAVGKPVAELLGETRRTRMPVLWMLATGETAPDIANGRQKIDTGYTAFKIKVGINPAGFDVGRAISIREAMPGVQISADANQGWTVEDALTFVEGVGTALDFVEQPVMGYNLDGMSLVQSRARLPIGADEGLHSVGDIRRHHELKAAQGGSLKMIKLGGVTRTHEAAAICGSLGMRINFAGKVAESSLATAGVLHLASVAPNLDWGLSVTQQYLATDIVKNPIVVRDGHVERPAGPGLGVEIDEAALQRFAIG